MYAEERQLAIATEVRDRGRVSVAQLATRFDVTGETVRRDLSVLADQGVVLRVHGGAVRPDVAAVVDEPDLSQRERSRLAEKTAIGIAAQAFVPPSGGSIMFDAGTTTLRAALALPADTELSVVTNALPLAAHLATLPLCEVTLVGGRVRGRTQAAVGAGTVAAFGRLRPSIAFLGTNGLSLEHGLSTPDPDEAAAKRAMIAAANRVVVLADSSKFNREDLVSFGTLDDVDVIVTDSGIDDAFHAELSALDIEVVIA
ncbi:MAG: DeoR/GlpR family DNA-binding transcription regulator [Gordonia sp. (in: high G+C Gram-positive bacteria)]|uniref:DeoR/GlpR family DNA-binding transcription regulator n=1 Tax=Gordonia sp. (in: high G+C Gram-positive bacteria) TaxID=84139 RepID=UPI0039E3BBA4